jgi:hypothetical protein
MVLLQQQMLHSSQMMCDVMKTTLSEDTSQGSDLLKPCSTKIGNDYSKNFSSVPSIYQYINIAIEL